MGIHFKYRQYPTTAHNSVGCRICRRSGIDEKKDLFINLSYLGEPYWFAADVDIFNFHPRTNLYKYVLFCKSSDASIASGRKTESAK